jgi:hypothetical protein
METDMVHGSLGHDVESMVQFSGTICRLVAARRQIPSRGMGT